MIRKIGLIYQDQNSLGFLVGLRDRLNCDATFVEPPTAIGKSRVLTRKQAKSAWAYFEKQGVDLVVRFTDADQTRWQDTRRDELARVPDIARAIWLCAVASENTEAWLCLDNDYLARVLNLSTTGLPTRAERTGFIKQSLTRIRQPGEGASDVVARIVRDAPRDAFRRWLMNDALRTFYSDCRSAAIAAGCDTKNELDSEAHA